MIRPIFYILLVTLSLCTIGCGDFEPIEPPKPSGGVDQGGEDPSTSSSVNIDLSNWKVTLPIGNPLNIEPPAILDYRNNEVLQDYMYDDPEDGALVFYTEPGTSTPNSSYSRTELREQMVSGNDNVNWTFEDGGRMVGELSLDDISLENNGNPHRTIIMQIHGRLTNDQRDRIGEDDNNAPPILKIYWRNDRVWLTRKFLKDLDTNDFDELFTDAWEDEGYWFDEIVGNNKFKLEVIVSKGRMEITLNDDEKMVFDDEHLDRWGVFENYFKAGNYLITTDPGAFARVKYYSLEVSH